MRNQVATVIPSIKPLDKNLFDVGVFEKEFTGKGPFVRQVCIVTESGTSQGRKVIAMRRDYGVFVAGAPPHWESTSERNASSKKAPLCDFVEQTCAALSCSTPRKSAPSRIAPCRFAP